jgi:hypothetical protein
LQLQRASIRHQHSDLLHVDDEAAAEAMNKDAIWLGVIIAFLAVYGWICALIGAMNPSLPLFFLGM